MGIGDYWRSYICRKAVNLTQYSIHNIHVQTHLMRTLEELPVMDIDPRVEMHSKGSADTNDDLPNINDSIYYIDNNMFDSIDNAEVAKSITNFLKSNGSKVTESIIDRPYQTSLFKAHLNQLQVSRTNSYCLSKTTIT